jgi:hypothetical protein
LSKNRDGYQETTESRLQKIVVLHVCCLTFGLRHYRTASYTRALSLSRRVLENLTPVRRVSVAIDPLIVCDCQFVASMIASSVAPPLRWIMLMTFAHAVPSRGNFGSPAGFLAFGDLAAFLGDAALGLPPLAVFRPLGADVFLVASFFLEVFSDATTAPVSATAAVWAVVVVSWARHYS